MLKKPELLVPAGDWPSLIAGAESGADSLYFGLKSNSMRQEASNFDSLELPKVMAYLHKLKLKGYLALNTFIRNQEITKIRTVLEMAKKSSVDAVILWDMAVFSIARDLNLEVHLSTQASVSNIEAVKFFAKLGAGRIVLARECSIEEIKQIVQSIDREKINCQIETFVHGALCLSVSGRCFLSEDSFSKSANRGECLQPCRREYEIVDKGNELSYRLGHNYILSPKDLCMIDCLDLLIDCGIDCFKIEGRMRSAEYTKIVTLAYRQAIDAVFNGNYTENLKIELLNRLKMVYNRGFSKGLFFGQPKDGFSHSLEHTKIKVFLGTVKKFYKKISVAEIEIVNNSLKKGDQLIFLGKKTAAKMMTATEIESNHLSVNEAVKGVKIGLKVPFKVNRGDKVFLWKNR
ncbi:MAG: U32 family peptidase [Candidatus Omnitrophica bacterium]|nr:U32 family peptidase [Candidatus Omnitrophota bacterium]